MRVKCFQLVLLCACVQTAFAVNISYSAQLNGVFSEADKATLLAAFSSRGSVTVDLSVAGPVATVLGVNPLPVAFDGQTYKVCSGDTVQVTWDGYHNIQEMSTFECSSENVGTETIGFKNTGDVHVFEADELAAIPGQTRYFKCSLHCINAKFAVMCPSPPPPTLTDVNFASAITACLSSNPVDGLCSSGEFGAMPYWDVSRVTNMQNAFNENEIFNGDISLWDTSSVTDMRSMFRNTRAFNQDISGWDTSSVTLMENMFYDSLVFNQDITGWSTPQLSTDYLPLNMFVGATAWLARFYRIDGSASVDGPPSAWTVISTESAF
jgi:surface protein